MRTSDGDDGTRVRRGEGDTNESGRREEEGEVVVFRSSCSCTACSNGLGYSRIT